MRGFVCMMQTMKLLICKQQLITSGNNGEPNWSYIPSKGKSTKTQFEFVSEIKKLVQKSANATDKTEQDSISRQRCLWTHQACHMIFLWICSEICLEMGIFSAISIGQTIYRKHRLGADDTLYCKSVYAWTPIGESRLVLIDRRII